MCFRLAWKVHPSRGLAALAAVLVLVPWSARAATPLREIVASPDVTLSLSGTPVDDEQGVSDDLSGGLALQVAAGLPSATAVVGLDLLPGGPALVSLDTSVVLPGNPSPITVRRGDVVRFLGSTYVLEFSAAASGLPPGAVTDAVSTVGGDLLLSFDTSVDLGGVVADDEDLVRWNGSTLALFLDASAVGISPALDLDAVHVAANGHLLISLDGSGTVGAISFDDEDVLELDPSSGTWELVYDGSARHSGWALGDLDALFAFTDSDGDGLADVDEAAAGTNALDPDSDDDGLLDGVETNTLEFVDKDDTGTDPLDADTDDDGFEDGVEVSAGSDPTDSSSTPVQIPALPGAGSFILAFFLLLITAWMLRRMGPTPAQHEVRSAERRRR